MGRENDLLNDLELSANDVNLEQPKRRKSADSANKAEGERPRRRKKSVDAGLEGERPRRKKSVEAELEGDERPRRKKSAVAEAEDVMRPRRNKSADSLEGGHPRRRKSSTPVSLKTGADLASETAQQAANERQRPTKASRPRKAPKAAEGGMARDLDELGSLLKVKREVNGLSRRDAALKIKIPLDQLEAIEDGRLSSLPPVFARGFLRAYANELGLDAESILADYSRLTTDEGKKEPIGKESLSPKYVATSVGGKRRFSLRVLVILVIILATAIMAWQLLPGLKSSGTPITTSGELSSGAETGSSDATASLTEQDANQTQSSLEGLTGGVLTLLSQNDNVWLQVEIDGNPPEFMILNSGDTVTWLAERFIVVKSGMANALNVTWDGNDLGLLSEGPIAERRFPN